ncbi:MAG TPA: bifunctional 4-hydroxy-2-oxoglutarate aldolase/2-dehydro-3-deoxy-phosphogluconate aldolase [Mesorhizobium sp.]|jgi:2-dehydro-3-deoxyphosphogluconate aldolase/(4S)-4-hydroxy-2-oxoglutarate aldolase|nr:bifunctional 4-hydroxy-2-oxoglutarate aldolase/2-dehydro-3-deoxy-phosphogluconate aldolase [Mesorhizobium sp.]
MANASLLALLGAQPVIPVLRIDDPEHAAPLARALAKGGLPLIEITLRTPSALEAIRRAADGAPEAVVGAGTVLSPRQFEAAAGAGARFVVSPGLTPALAATADGSGTPFLPGATTASEVMAAQELGFSFLKFFPAEAAGGAAFLKALASPIPDVRFCPTGGVGEGNARAYLDLPNVACVGGSWVAPDAFVRDGRWDEIERLARAASSLRG